MLPLREARPQEVGVSEARSREGQVNLRGKAAPHQRVGSRGFGSSTSCCTASSSVDGVRTKSRTTCFHLDAGTTLCTHPRSDALGFRSSCLCVPAKLCGEQREPFLLGSEVAQCERGPGGVQPAVGNSWRECSCWAEAASWTGRE